MDVRMVLQVLAPGVQNRDKPISAPRWRRSAAIVLSVSAAALNRIA